MPNNFSSRITPIMQRIIDALTEYGDMDQDDIAETACVSINSLAGGYMRQMESNGLVRVSKYRRNTYGVPTPIYSVTPGKPASRPRPMTASQRSMKWEAKSRTPEYRQRNSLAELVRITACS